MIGFSNLDALRTLSARNLAFKFKPNFCFRGCMKVKICRAKQYIMS